MATRRLLLAILALAGIAGRASAGDEATPAQIFEKRILPIFKSPSPSSCTQCHLAAVDLKNYIQPSHEKTFLSLRDQGLVDLEKPAQSKILRLINRGANEGANLIQQKVRTQELEAFAAWIEASAADPALRAAPKLPPAEIAQPKRPNEVIRNARVDRVLDSFVVNVWSQRERCFYCHSGQGGGNAKAVAENGPEVTWMKAGPAETMAYLASSRAVNAKAPDKSLLLTKPTNQVKHGGGQKMIVGDMAYKAFRTWLEDYAKTVGDQYAKASDLPKADSPTLHFGTQIRLKIANTPPAWGDRMLQVDLHAWDAKKGAWEAEPIATSDRGVWGKGKLWAHELWLTAARDSERAKAWQSGRPALPAGRYLIRAYLDLQGKLQQNWKTTLGKAEFVGQQEFNGELRDGAETSIEASQFKR